MDCFEGCWSAAAGNTFEFSEGTALHGNSTPDAEAAADEEAAAGAAPEALVSTAPALAVAVAALAAGEDAAGALLPAPAAIFDQDWLLVFFC
jgi:hypothetical protein